MFLIKNMENSQYESYIERYIFTQIRVITVYHQTVVEIDLYTEEKIADVPRD